MSAQPIIPPDLRKKPRRPVNSDVRQIMLKELGFWSFAFFALVHLVAILANSNTLRKESGSHFQLALKLFKLGGIRGWLFSMSFFLLVLSFVVMLATR